MQRKLSQRQKPASSFVILASSASALSDDRRGCDEVTFTSSLIRLSDQRWAADTCRSFRERLPRSVSPSSRRNVSSEPAGTRMDRPL